MKYRKIHCMILFLSSIMLGQSGCKSESLHMMSPTLSGSGEGLSLTVAAGEDSALHSAQALTDRLIGEIDKDELTAAWQEVKQGRQDISDLIDLRGTQTTITHKIIHYYCDVVMRQDDSEQLFKALVDQGVCLDTLVDGKGRSLAHVVAKKKAALCSSAIFWSKNQA